MLGEDLHILLPPHALPVLLSQAVGEVNEPTVPLVHHQLSYIF